MIRFLISFVLLLVSTIAQRVEIEDSMVWLFTESVVPGCPNALGTPRFTRYASPFPPQLTVYGSNVVQFSFENLEPSSPFFATIVLDTYPTTSPVYCIQAMHELLFFGFANQTGHAVVSLNVPGSVSPYIMPGGTNYFGMMQVISFTSTTSYSTSNPILVYGLN